MWWVSFLEPADALSKVSAAGRPDQSMSPVTGPIMEPAPPDDLPNDILIVEDDPIIALDFEDMILGFGVTSVRTAANVATALDMIAARAPDFALLDVGLIHEQSFEIAEKLADRDIPFAFATGYGAGRVPAAFADRPRLPKPCSSEALLAVLKTRPRGAA